MPASRSNVSLLTGLFDTGSCGLRKMLVVSEPPKCLLGSRKMVVPLSTTNGRFYSLIRFVVIDVVFNDKMVC